MQQETQTLQDQAKELYQELKSDCPELWEGIEEIEIEAVADCILDVFVDSHPEAEQDMIDAVMDNILEGLK
jgi:hypothetical protein